MNYQQFVEMYKEKEVNRRQHFSFKKKTKRQHCSRDVRVRSSLHFINCSA